MIQLRGRLKPAEWDLVTKYDDDDSRRYQVTCDGFHESRQSLGSGMDLSRFPELCTQVDARPARDLTFLDISLLPIAIFEEGWGSPTHVQGLVLTPKNAAAGIYERVAHFRANDTRAAYLFLEKSSGNRAQGALQTSSGRREVLGPKDRVEGFPLRGTQKWTKIQERDIIIV